MFLKNGRQLKAARVLAGQTQRELPGGFQPCDVLR